MASVWSPLLRGYRLLLYPVVKPSAMMMDALFGKEAIRYFRETELKEIIRRHMLAEESEVDRIEAIGALNFLSIDDLPIEKEGVPIDPESIVRVPLRNGLPHFPSFRKSADDPFLKQINAAGKAWVVIADEYNQPHLMMDADGFLRHALFTDQETDPAAYCHRPVIIRDRKAPLGSVIAQLRFDMASPEDHIITYDTVLLWTDAPRLITGSDLLGRLLRGIATRTRG
jgi:metal transporter CNNM